MKTQIEKFLEKITNEIREATFNLKDENKRFEEASNIFESYFSANQYEYVGEVPAQGANGSVTEMSSVYRFQVRCGYGKHNYAPCFEVSKKVIENLF